MLERPPLSLSAEVIDFCRSIFGTSGPLYVRARPEKGAKQRDCFNIVKRRCQKSGGKIRYGWSIWEWPRVWLAAEHHGVWEHPNGDLFDLTPHSRHFNKIVFLPDDQQKYDFLSYKRIPNKWRLLQHDSDIDKCIASFMDIFIFEEEKTNPDTGVISMNSLEYKKLIHQNAINLAKIWLKYHDGNEPCICRSGKAAKACHGPTGFKFKDINGNPIP